MKAYVFPGQGAQFPGMGKELYESNEKARAIFDLADEVLSYKLTEVMFQGSAEELKETKFAQPSLYVHSMAVLRANVSEFEAAGVAGHSLGEFTALTAAGVLSFEDGLRLVYARAMAMQKCCEAVPGTMAAVLGLEDHVVEEVCAGIDEIVVAANYNCPGQLVISGSLAGVAEAEALLKERGAKRVLPLQVGGAFHSPLMESAGKELAEAIKNTPFKAPLCPIFQNFTAEPATIPILIQHNLIDQLTGPVRWTQTIRAMSEAGITSFIECGGNGKVLSGLIKKVDRDIETVSMA
jgi:[acyl-carrier-protein] S-malonyltransferase